MRIDDVRNLLDKYSKDQLRLIIAEMYKAMPKKLKEEKDIDSLLSAPEQFRKSKTTKSQKATIPDVEMVAFDVAEFIENAYNQYYFAPNSVVPKRQRPKWRFTAKRFYKDLLAAAADENQLQRASELLKQLYVLLCYSCDYILFSGDDPFWSVQIDQTTFLRSVLTLRNRHQPQKDFATEAVSLIVDNSVNCDTLKTELMNVAMEFFPTPDAKESAIEACDALLKSTQKAPPQRKDALIDRGRFDKQRRIQDLATMAFFCCASLHECERGLAYFQRKDVFFSKQQKANVTLEHLFDFGQKELFISEYEKAINQGTEPGDTWTKAYNTLRETGEFPDRL